MAGSSLILRTSAPLLLAIPVVVSVIILVRGHNDPGGGFLGGLMAAAGLVLYAIARGADAARAMLRFEPVAICGVGVVIAALSGVPALLMPDLGFLTHFWWFPDVGIKLPLGTALIFDIGVYITVFGTVSALFLSLASPEAS
jgi:multicomponent Na+:H+ antiporter subunit B